MKITKASDFIKQLELYDKDSAVESNIKMLKIPSVLEFCNKNYLLFNITKAEAKIFDITLL